MDDDDDGGASSGPQSDFAGFPPTKPRTTTGEENSESSQQVLNTHPTTSRAELLHELSLPHQHNDSCASRTHRGNDTALAEQQQQRTPTHTHNLTSQAQVQQHQPTTQRVRQYIQNSKGPFIVFIREIHAKLSPIKFALHINKHYGKSVELIKHNHDKIRVVMKESDDANRLVVDDAFENYHVYIPADLVEVSGVISHDDLCDVDCMQDIIVHGSGKHGNVNLPKSQVLDAQRLSRVSENSTRVLTNAVKVTFAGLVLPKYLEIGGLLVHVRPFHAKAMFCDTCQQFGHTSRFCRRNPKCARCGSQHSTDTCKTPISQLCPYCLTQHSPGRNNCAFFKEANDGFRIKQANRRKSRRQQAVAVANRAAVNVQNSYDSLAETECTATDQIPPTSAADLHASNPQTQPRPPQFVNPYERFSQSSKRRPNRTAADNKSKRQKSSSETTHLPASSQQQTTAPTRTWAEVTRQSATNNISNATPSSTFATIKRSILQVAEQAGLSPVWISILEQIIDPLLQAIMPQLSTILNALCSIQKPQNA